MVWVGDFGFGGCGVVWFCGGCDGVCGSFLFGLVDFGNGLG